MRRDSRYGTAPPWWLGHASFSLLFAEGGATRGDVVACAGSLARAVMAVDHARLAEREWALNEKRLVERAGLTTADEVRPSSSGSGWPGGRR